MSLYIAIITFFILILIQRETKNVYYLVLMGFMGIFIAYSISDIFSGPFNNQIAGAFTQQYWIQLLYGLFILICFGRAAVNAYSKRPSTEVE